MNPASRTKEKMHMSKHMLKHGSFWALQHGNFKSGVSRKLYVSHSHAQTSK